MQDDPTPVELIGAAADFLRSEIMPQLKGHSAFKLRVTINALDLVARQLTLEPASDAAEITRLKGLLGINGSLADLNRELADRIAWGDATLKTPDVRDHLWQTTLDKLAIDQPNYGSFRREVERES